MTFRDCIDRVLLEMGRSQPSAEEVRVEIIRAYRLSGSRWLLASQDYVRLLVEATVWYMENSWQRDKFEELVRLGP